MELSQQNLEEALRLLGNLLATRKGDGFWLVVCGGSALLARKIITRSTEDVDILAMRDWEGGVDRAYPMPEAAVRWALDHIPVLSHRNKLPALLTLLGHAHLIPKFQG